MYNIHIKIAFIEGSLSSLEMMRRARSFEVGEWHNSMAGSASTANPPGAPISSTAYLCSGGGGASSSNSSSSWQLANNISTTSVPYASPRPDVICIYFRKFFVVDWRPKCLVLNTNLKLGAYNLFEIRQICTIFLF